MNVDIQEIAGLPCPGCGVGDQLEILELDREYAYIREGQVYHSIECFELLDPSTILNEG